MDQVRRDEVRRDRGPVLPDHELRTPGSCGLEQAGRQPLLDDHPAVAVLDRVHDAGVPAVGALRPLQEEAGEPAVPVGDPAVLDRRRGRGVFAGSAADPALRAMRSAIEP